MLKKLKHIIKNISSLLFITSCGGSSGVNQTADTVAIASEFVGIGSLVKQDDNTWLIKWEPIKSEGIVYSVFKAAKNKEFDYKTPLISTQQNIYRYEPENIFTEDSTCFVVRITNIAGDTNTKTECTTDTPLKFSGIKSIAQQSGGEYLLGWDNIPVSGVIYTIYESKNGAQYTFNQPSIDALKNNFYKTPVIERGDKYCYIVRYSHRDLDKDENIISLCTKQEEKISFLGLNTISKELNTQTNKLEVTLSWNLSSTKGITGYRIYNGSAFKEIITTVNATTASHTFNNLIPSTQYDFGVRAIDEFGREDKNVTIIPVITN